MTTQLTWTPDNDTLWPDIYALACTPGATAEAEWYEGGAQITARGPIHGEFCIHLGERFLLGSDTTPDHIITRLTVTAPAPEPDWVADGICVDADGDTWELHNEGWFHPESVGGYSASDLQNDFGPISRHPAVIAAEKRGEKRVLHAANAAMGEAHDDAATVGATVASQHAAELQAVQRLLDRWADQ